MTTVSSRKFLPYGCQDIDQADIDAVIAVLRSDYLTTGPVVKEFEKTLASRFNAGHALSVNSGTAALHIALAGLGIGEGDWVIVPAITFLSTANVVRHQGAEVIFADVDSDSGLMGPKQLLEAIESNQDKNIKAVIPVHLGGQTENLVEISRIARAHQLFIIEDACHALGTEYIDGEHYMIGHCRHSDAVAFSFHPVKAIAMGEGGAMITHHKVLYDKANLFRNHGMSRQRDAFIHQDRALGADGLLNAWYYEMHELGLNYRASDINCALGLKQLTKLSRFISKRRQLVSCYDRLLKPLAPLVQPVKRTRYANPGWHLYSVLIDFDHLKIDRAYLMEKLREQQIGTQVHYIPVNEQPYYQKRYGATALVGARDYYKRTLSLPLYPALTEEDLAYVVDCLKEII